MFIKGIPDPERTQGLQAPAVQGEHHLITLKGPGSFISAQVSKQGGSNDLSFVSLDIDGRNVVNISFAALINTGLTQNNPYGLVLVKSTGNLKTLSIGYSSHLYFKKELSLSVIVKEDGVDQILANIVHGK